MCVRVCLPVCSGPCTLVEGATLNQGGANLLSMILHVNRLPLPPPDPELPRCPSPLAVPLLWEHPIHRLPVFPEPTRYLAR